MEMTKVKVGVIVALLALGNSFASAVETRNGLDSSGWKSAPVASYQALIKKNGKLIKNGTEVNGSSYKTYKVGTPVVYASLSSGGTYGATALFQTVDATTNYTGYKSTKAKKDPFYSFSVSNRAAVRAQYNFSVNDLTSVNSNKTATKSATKAFIEANTSDAVQRIYVGVDKSTDKQNGLLGKYVVYMNRILSRTATEGGAVKEYAKRLVTGVVSVYSKNGSVYIKTSGGIDRSSLSVSLVSTAGNTDEVVDTWSDLDVAKNFSSFNKELQAATSGIDSFYLDINGISMKKDFWYALPKANAKYSEQLFVDVFAESTVNARQLDKMVISGDVKNMPSVVVPEPATIGILALGGLLAGRRFKK